MASRKITRESLLNDDIGQWRRKYADRVAVIDPQSFDLLLSTALRSAPPCDQVWVFAYGSLLWNPAIDVAEQRVGRLYGYHRSFCLQSLVGRGTTRYPGLMLGLEKGGSCVGLAYRLPTERHEEELRLVFRREMMTGAYCPKWADVHTEAGPVKAMAFVMNPASARYLAGLTEVQVCEVLRKAKGPLGCNRDYLYQTVDSLRANGIRDPRMERLERLVRQVGPGTTTRRSRS